MCKPGSPTIILALAMALGGTLALAGFAAARSGRRGHALVTAALSLVLGALATGVLLSSAPSPESVEPVRRAMWAWLPNVGWLYVAAAAGWAWAGWRAAARPLALALGTLPMVAFFAWYAIEWFYPACT